MAAKYSKEFVIDNVSYLLESSCEQRIWPKLCDRVEKELVRIGKEAAKSMYGMAKASGKTRFGNVGLVTFELTIHPTGNTFS